MPWTLRRSYTLLAPLYDATVEGVFRRARQESLKALPAGARQRVLINGIGTGLDVPFLPPGNDYIGTDVTRAMLRRARARAAPGAVALVEADSLRLPFADGVFDHVVLHLILAVVPAAGICLREAARVVKPGGRLIVFDKFLRPGQAAPLRRLLNGVARHIATRTDVVLEDALRGTPGLRVLEDRPAMAAGWFRHVVLMKERAG